MHPELQPANNKNLKPALSEKVLKGLGPEGLSPKPNAKPSNLYSEMLDPPKKPKTKPLNPQTKYLYRKPSTLNRRV